MTLQMLYSKEERKSKDPYLMLNTDSRGRGIICVLIINESENHYLECTGN